MYNYYLQQVHLRDCAYLKENVKRDTKLDQSTE